MGTQKFYRPLIQRDGDGIAEQGGWGNYVDGQYTEGAPLSLVADTRTLIDNDGLGALTNENFLPPDVSTFFDGTNSKILCENGWGLMLTIEMTGKPTTATTTFLDLELDIGAPVGAIYPRTVTFPKGQNVGRPFSFTIGGYALGTFELNGGQWFAQANAAIDLYDIRYIVHRVSKPA